MGAGGGGRAVAEEQSWAQGVGSGREAWPSLVSPERLS